MLHLRSLTPGHAVLTAGLHSRGLRAALMITILLGVVLLTGSAVAQQVRTEAVPGRAMSVTGPDGRTHVVPPTAVAGEVLVVARPGVTEAQMAQVAAAVDCEVTRRSAGSRRYVIALPAGMSVTQGEAVWQGRPEVAAASPNYVAVRLQVPPRDPLYPQQWQWPNTNAPAAWNVTTGSPQTVVAVIDDGVQMLSDGVQDPHPDLGAKLWRNTRETQNGMDSDGNGYVDDLYGWDFVNNGNNINPDADYDDPVHGTHVAGLVGAVANNNEGVVGYDWQCKLMSLKVFGSGARSGSYDIVADAIDYAVANGAHIVNLSLGGPFSEVLNDPIQNAVMNNVLVVAAAGNESHVFTDDRSTWMSPVCNDGPGFTDNWVLGVGAVGDDDTVAEYSNLDGSSRSFVDVMAPGGDTWNNRGILSTVPYIPVAGLYQYYDTFEGTSMAAPVAAGLAGLMRSRFPTMAPEQLINQMKRACDNIDAVNPQHIGLMGAGRINGGKSVVHIPPQAPRSVSAFDTPGDDGGSVTVVWSRSLDDGRGADSVVGYDVERSEEGSEGPFTTIASLPPRSTTYEDTDVVDGEEYWYRIRVRDHVTFSLSRVAGPAIPRDDTPPPPVTTLRAEDTPADAGGAITLFWHGYVAPPDFSHYNIYRAQRPFTSVKASGVTRIARISAVGRQYYLDQYSDEDPHPVDGVEYWYAVTAVDDVRDSIAPDGNEDPNVTSAGPVVSSPNFTFSYPPGVSIIAIGAHTHETHLAALFGIPAETLLIARWDPTLGAYRRYSENPNDPQLRQALGRAFWLSTADPLTLDIAGQPAPEGDFAVPFAAGWNMVGNPYTTDCDLTGAQVTVGGETRGLADAARRGWTRDYMWGYDAFLRSYVLLSPVIEADFADDTLRRGRGAFFRAFTDGTLTLPRPEDAAVPSGAPAQTGEPVTVDWQIRLVAETSDAADVDNFAGVSAQAAALNAITSPPIRGVDLFFPGPGGVRGAASFAEPGAGDMSCAVTVAAEQAGPVTIRWPDLSEVPHDIRPVLVDTASGSRVYMRTVSQYTYEAEAGGIREFRLELKVGGTGALAVQTLAATEAPVGAQVVFALSRDAAATVEVLNMAGRRVRTLLSAGPVSANTVTTLTWDGRTTGGTRAPAGRYLLRITATADDGQSVSAMRAVSIRR